MLYFSPTSQVFFLLCEFQLVLRNNICSLILGPQSHDDHLQLFLYIETWLVFSCMRGLHHAVKCDCMAERIP